MATRGPITFRAILTKVQTLKDGGWRVTLDVPEIDTHGALEISKLRQHVLGVAVIPEDQEIAPASGVIDYGQN